LFLSASFLGCDVVDIGPTVRVNLTGRKRKRRRRQKKISVWPTLPLLAFSFFSIFHLSGFVLPMVMTGHGDGQDLLLQAGDVFPFDAGGRQHLTPLRLAHERVGLADAKIYLVDAAAAGGARLENALHAGGLARQPPRAGLHGHVQEDSSDGVGGEGFSDAVVLVIVVVADGMRGREVEQTALLGVGVAR
jgi:hypothetical protein